MNIGATHVLRIWLVVALVSCGDDATSDDTIATTVSTTTSTASSNAEPDPTTTTSSTPFPAPTTSVAPVITTTTTTTTAAASTTTTPTTLPPATVPVPAESLAVWPAADVVFDTPEAAAADFVSQVLGVPPVIGEFQQGDTRSGEIVVFSPTDDDDPATLLPRGLLTLRQLGGNDGWFVTAGTSAGVSITSPAPAANVSAGLLTVEGLGRGFESNLVVRAILAGDIETRFDVQFTMTDWTTPVPYAVTLDLSAADLGDVIALVAVGDTGLGTDPSEFAAIPVVVGS